MGQYELVREIPNLCRNNQMRDVFIEEIETQDPVAYVKALFGGEAELTAEERADGCVTVYAQHKGLFQKFFFTPID